MDHRDDKQNLKEIKQIVEELKQTQKELSTTATMNKGFVIRRPFAKLKKRIIIFVLLLIIAIIAFMGIRSALFKEKGTEKATSFVEQIQDLSTLATSKAYMKAVVEQEDNELFGKKIDANIPGTKRKILVIIPGEVVAGVDLSKVTDQNMKINEEKKIIHLTLPRAEIIQKPTLDFDQAQIYSSEGLFRGEASIDEGYDFADLAQKQIVKEAIEQGLLTSAEEQATRVIQTFLHQMGYKATVEFTDQ